MSLLTGGGDRPYALAWRRSSCPEVRRLTLLAATSLTVQNSMPIGTLSFEPPGRSILKCRVPRQGETSVLVLCQACTLRPGPNREFFIFWNNKFEVFDRTLLMLYYRILGKRIVLTVHNVNGKKRDGRTHGSIGLP